MADNSPNGLELDPKKKLGILRIARMSKGPLYIGIFGALIMFAILVYSVNFAHNPEDEQAKAKEVDIQESEKPLLMGEGKGLALRPPAGSPAIVQPPAPKMEEKGGREPLLVVRGESEQSNEYRQELENLRRMRSQALITALAAPIGAKKASGSPAAVQASAGEAGQGAARNASALSGLEASAGSQGYDPAADKDKEAFFSRAGKDDAWTLPDTRTPGQRFEMKSGTVLPAVMVTGINSDLPGQIIAQVSQNVFDTATGKYLLVPQGAKLFGVYDSRVVYGQERVLVAWNRLLFPDGSSVSLGAMPGADMSGYAGYNDKVDNHYLRIFGSAVLMSLITGGMSYSMDSLSSGNSDSDKPSLQDEMGSALVAQMGQTTLTLLQKNLNIKPTLEIRPGYQFNLVVTKDVVFERPYKAGR